MEYQLATSNHELAATASAAMAKAEIESAYIMAMKRPRNIADVRVKILEACKRPGFAETAEYSKPVGGGKVRGPSIRFVETALQTMKNTRTSTTVTYEDDRVRKIKVVVTDLEENTAYGLDATINKTVERKSLKKGQKAISERLNSNGETVYLVEATEDDMQTKQNAIVSKMIRGCGLRLIPQDIVDEAMRTARETLSSGGKDPRSFVHAMLDAFAKIGIKPSEIEQYLGKTAAQINNKDVDELRGIFNAIRDGEAKWSDYVQDSDPAPQTVEDQLMAKSDKAAQTPAKDPFAGLDKKCLDKAKAQTKIGLDSRKLTDDEINKVLAVYEEIKEGDI